MSEILNASFPTTTSPIVFKFCMHVVLRDLFAKSNFEYFLKSKMAAMGTGSDHVMQAGNSDFISQKRLHVFQQNFVKMFVVSNVSNSTSFISVPFPRWLPRLKLDLRFSEIWKFQIAFLLKPHDWVFPNIACMFCEPSSCPIWNLETFRNPKWPPQVAKVLFNIRIWKQRYWSAPGLAMRT